MAPSARPFLINHWWLDTTNPELLGWIRQSNQEFIRCFHQFVSRIFLNLSSWKEKKTFYWSKSWFFASWKGNQNKYSLKNFAVKSLIQDSWKHLMNYTEAFKCSVEIQLRLRIRFWSSKSLSSSRVTLGENRSLKHLNKAKSKNKNSS